MGAGQSSSPSIEDTTGHGKQSQSPSTSTPVMAESSDTATPNAATKAKIKPPKNESGYAKAGRICRKKKRAYDACYTDALSSKEEDCSDLFESYRSCFLRVMAKDMEKRGVKASENSMIGEYKEEVADEENDR